ncbi:hypothetical protein AAY51_23640, partial [Vibrio parahaemolyticus]
LLMLAVGVIGVFLAHRTRVGNQVYAIGGEAAPAEPMGGFPPRTTNRPFFLLNRAGAPGGGVFFFFTPGGHSLG